MNFEQLNLIAPLLQAVKSHGYVEPTPIQQQTIPLILQGKDIFGSAQTGTGKTAAFALPLLQLIHNKTPKTKGIKALILAPTRELAVQIGESFRIYGKNLRIFHSVVYGGVSQFQQAKDIRRGVDILVATPGRLLDLMQQKIVHLNQVEYFVLDEADRMLDMGFIVDIKKIIQRVPQRKQTIMFSATSPPEIQQLMNSLLNQPVRIDIEPDVKAVDVEQKLYYVEKSDKMKLLAHIIQQENIAHALVFTRTKRWAERLSVELKRSGIFSDAIHGDKSQYARQKALDNFKKNKTKILVATDVASRGIDIKFLPYVINYDLPENADTYTHRIGRTGRAGAKGVAISFASSEERMLLKQILKLFVKNIVVQEHPFATSPPVELFHKKDNAHFKPAHSQHNKKKRFFGNKNRFRKKSGERRTHDTK